MVFGLLAGNSDYPGDLKEPSGMYVRVMEPRAASLPAGADPAVWKCLYKYSIIYVAFVSKHDPE